MGWPYAEAQAYKADVEGNFMATMELVPEFAARLRGATREAPFLGGAVPAWFRKPYGDGWALVGDAGYNKDPITAQGITDAFLDAERCTDAIDQWLHDGKPYNDAMSAWHQARDAKAMPIYEFTAQLATLELPPPEMQQLLGAMRRQPGGHGRLRQRRLRSRVTGGLLLRGERRADLRAVSHRLRPHTSVGGDLGQVDDLRESGAVDRDLHPVVVEGHQPRNGCQRRDGSVALTDRTVAVRVAR